VLLMEQQVNLVSVGHLPSLRQVLQPQHGSVGQSQQSAASHYSAPPVSLPATVCARRLFAVCIHGTDTIFFLKHLNWDAGGAKLYAAKEYRKYKLVSTISMQRDTIDDFYVEFQCSDSTRTHKIEVKEVHSLEDLKGAHGQTMKKFVKAEGFPVEHTVARAFLMDAIMAMLHPSTVGIYTAVCDSLAQGQDVALPVYKIEYAPQSVMQAKCQLSNSPIEIGELRFAIGKLNNADPPALKYRFYKVTSVLNPTLNKKGKVFVIPRDMCSIPGFAELRAEDQALLLPQCRQFHEATYDKPTYCHVFGSRSTPDVMHERKRKLEGCSDAF